MVGFEKENMALLENTSDSIIVLQEGIIKYVNSNGSRSLGYDVDRLVNHPYGEFVYPEDLPLVDNWYEKRRNFEPVPHVYPFRMITKSGAVIWFEIHAIEGGGFMPVGGTRAIYPDIRIIGATNKNLAELVNKGEMRGDFFYRVSIIPITLPPLRKRMEDLPLLICHFLEKLGMGSELASIPPRCDPPPPRLFMARKHQGTSECDPPLCDHEPYRHPGSI